jgi:hypothetical protein
MAPQTTYYYNSPMLFEKVNGEWKMPDLVIKTKNF